MAKWHGINFGNKIRQNSSILKGVQIQGSTLRFTKGDDTTQDVSLSSGGGMTETPLMGTSGRAQWSTADAGERVIVGSSYGPIFYNHTNEMGDYASGTVDTTTVSRSAYLRNVAQGFHLPTDSKKVRLKIGWRIQNGNSGDFGFSLWSGPAATGGSTASANITLRAQSDDVTVGTSSIASYRNILTTTSAITDDLLFITLDHRSGTFTTTAYMYFNLMLFLVD